MELSQESIRDDNPFRVPDINNFYFYAEGRLDVMGIAVLTLIQNGIMYYHYRLPHRVQKLAYDYYCQLRAVTDKLWSDIVEKEQRVVLTSQYWKLCAIKEGALSSGDNSTTNKKWNEVNTMNSRAVEFHVGNDVYICLDTRFKVDGVSYTKRTIIELDKSG